jgi:hypothetical protein
MFAFRAMGEETADPAPEKAVPQADPNGGELPGNGAPPPPEKEITSGAVTPVPRVPIVSDEIALSVTVAVRVGKTEGVNPSVTVRVVGAPLTMVSEIKRTPRLQR